MHRDVQVVSMRRCAKSRSLDKSDPICKKLTANRTKRIVIPTHVLRVSLLRCCFIHRCLDKADCGAKNLIAHKTNRIVKHRKLPIVLMRRCLITCCLDKSDRIGIEMCYALYCRRCVIIAYFWNNCFNLCLTGILLLNFPAKSFLVRRNLSCC